jgi:thiol-disulfide isomerase/thioredoxin
MQRIARFLNLVLILSLCLFIPKVTTGLAAGPKSPEFSLADLSGDTRTLSEFRNRVVILDFWATWCPPCRMSIPELVKLQEKYESQGLVILGVSLDDETYADSKYLRAFKKKFKINYTILRYNEKVLQDYFGNTAPVVPTMFIIDRQGHLSDTLVGFNPGAVEKSLERVL